MQTLVVAAHVSHFNTFRNAMAADPRNTRQARALIYVDSVGLMEKHLKWPTYLVGPFWEHAHFDRIMRMILKRCEGRPAVALQWFPCSVGQSITISSSGLLGAAGQALPNSTPPSVG